MNRPEDEKEIRTLSSLMALNEELKTTTDNIADATSNVGNRHERRKAAAIERKKKKVKK